MYMYVCAYPAVYKSYFTLHFNVVFLLNAIICSGQCHHRETKDNSCPVGIANSIFYANPVLVQLCNACNMLSCVQAIG